VSQNTDFLPFARPQLGIEEEEAVLRIMRSGWLTTGSETLAFEKEFAEFVGAKTALAVNSATSGLHLALEAVGVKPGDTVITSPYTFASSAAVVRHLGAEVLFCDTAQDSYNIDPVALERVLKKSGKVRAIVVVHIGGLPCDMDAILTLARMYGCAVVEDAAHAFPSLTDKGYAGTLGDIGVYSFYATKTITTGEGGMIVSNNPALLERMARMRMHGIDRQVWDRYTSKKASWVYSVVEAGYKYNLPDILSAIGRVQLAKAKRFLEERTAIAKRYDQSFSSIPCLQLPPRGKGHAWHLYALRVHPSATGMNRDQLVESLSAQGIGSSVHFIPLHTMPYWATRYTLKPSDFPNALNMFERSISLPIWHGMTESQVTRVIGAVNALASKAASGTAARHS